MSELSHNGAGRFYFRVWTPPALHPVVKPLARTRQYGDSSPLSAAATARRPTPRIRKAPVETGAALTNCLCDGFGRALAEPQCFKAWGGSRGGRLSFTARRRTS